MVRTCAYCLSERYESGGTCSLVDPVHHVSIFYCQEILGMLRSYSEIHPALRNLICEVL